MKAIDLRMPIVEPFVQDSIAGGLREGYDGVRFSDMFDLETFNRVSRTEGAADVVPYSTYLTHAPYEAVFVQMDGLKMRDSHQVPPPEVVWAAELGSGQCFQPDFDASITLPHYRDGHHYCYVRVVRGYHQILKRNAISAEEFYSTVLGGREPRALTVVLSLWRTPWQVKDCPEVTHTIPKIQDSPRLQEAVHRYRQRLLPPSGQFVAVMLRAEHAYLMIQSRINQGRPTNYTLQRCLDEVTAKARTVMVERNTSSVFVTADVGLYGTNTWMWALHNPHKHEFPAITAQVQEAVERLYAGSWSFQEWEDSFAEATGGVKDRGYVAALQRVLASQAACLVLLGGGSFQALSLTSYLHRTAGQPHTRCVHLVCMDRNYAADFTRQIKSS